MANTGFLESLSPWGSRVATPKIPSNEGLTTSPHGANTGDPQRQKQEGADHRVSPRYRISPKDYPEDCPPIKVRWFYATDIHKRKPGPVEKSTENGLKVPGKPTAEPKKYVPFSARDSRSIELAFHKLADEEEQTFASQGSEAQSAIEMERGTTGAGSIGEKVNTSMSEHDMPSAKQSVKVPVNEDFLFDVDIDARELGPAYWHGPIYDVRRGSWFYIEGSNTRPCDENLAMQLEEGYIKNKPWKHELSSHTRSASATQTQYSSWMFAERPKAPSGSSEARDGPIVAEQPDAKNTETPAPEMPGRMKTEPLTHRLFGTHMNSIVTYQDSKVAWLLTDDFLSRMSSTVYQRLSGGGHLGGVKLVRGYAEIGKSKSAKEPVISAEVTEGTEGDRSTPFELRKRPEAETATKPTEGAHPERNIQKETESARQALERQISQLSGLTGGNSDEAAAAEEEEVRRKEEEEIREDYRDAEDVEQDREIEHLVLVTHGIGQRLGLKLESLNFIHDVNVFRKSLKGIYEKSPDLQALNEEVQTLPKNCRIQVLPVVWRHLLDFPHQHFKENKEKDLSDVSTFSEDLGYPNLKDITIEGITPVRNLVEDLFLDVLLYQSDYRRRIVHIIQKESNRIYNLFTQRNPNFHGKVSLVGHSLGSALFFDLLCHQSELLPRSNLHQSASLRLQRSSSIKFADDSKDELALDFSVEDFYCLGSPIGLFQMIKGKSVSARRPHHGSVPLGEAIGTPRNPPSVAENVTTSSPKCAQFYNIFHPTDPVAYRIEPLISPAMKDLRPQPLPYVKKGIFDMPAQGLSGLGVRVGQSVSGLWSSVTTGVASSLLNRSLGLQPAPAKNTSGKGFQLLRLTGYSPKADNQPGPSTRDSPLLTSVAEKEHVGEEMPSTPSTDILEHPPTLIDSKLETLYAGFQRQRRLAQSNDSGGQGAFSENTDWKVAEERARQLRIEENKVRNLNANGRVDYSIQEGVFDISLIGSIASHLSYWGDEDVNHFIISQLLARQRVVKRNV